MDIIRKKIILDFAKKHPQSRNSLYAWLDRAESANWKTPADIKTQFRSADFLSQNRIIFDISGNKYRLIVKALYFNGSLFVIGVYTHAEYSRLNLNE